MFLLEFFPELILLLDNIKKHLKNPLYFAFFLSFLLLLYVAIFIQQNLWLGLLALLCFTLVSYLLSNLDKKSSLSTHTETVTDKHPTTTINLIETKQTYTFHYRDMLQPQQFIITMTNGMIIKAIIGAGELGLEQASYIIINQQAVYSRPLSHLKAICCGIIYRQKIIDQSGQLWSIKLRIWGIFKPRLIVMIIPITG